MARILLTAFLVVITYAARRRHLRPPSSPELPPSIQPTNHSRWTMIGTVMAGAAAIAALIVASLALFMQTQDRADRLERERQTFASRVTFWFEANKASQDIMFIQNSNTEPMIGALVMPSDQLGEFDAIMLGALPPCSITYGDTGMSPVLVLRQKTGELPTPLSKEYDYLLIADPQNRQWLRRSDGDVREVTGWLSDRRVLQHVVPVGIRRKASPSCSSN
ncbi:hypothetical protein [Streptosporangium sp. NPDC006930]|uniref:hypothetical protein n=1 Tax=Streptosporangium sp. NPDC006930 TaxID=3154783 RepID=UPI003440E18D